MKRKLSLVPALLTPQLRPMRNILLMILTILTTYCYAQTAAEQQETLTATAIAMQPVLQKFGNDVLTKDLDTCIAELIKKSDDPYKQFIAGNMLYEVDREKSLKLNKAAYTAMPGNNKFALEYAMRRHRHGDYKEAAKLYEQYGKGQPEDFRVNVWLADCYINTGDTALSITNWNKAGHASHHTSIDQAICTIYQQTDQVRKRNDYRRQVAAGNREAFYSLIFGDMNWERDWWNTTVQKDMLEEDLALGKEKFSESDKDYKTALAYICIKQLPEVGSDSNRLAITALLKENRPILDNQPWLENGQITSDLLRMCFMNKVLSEKEFYTQRGAALLEDAKATKDKELLNIYAYLQAVVNGHVDPEIDKMGWVDFKDERFMVSYFSGKHENMKDDDPELAQAMREFLDCAMIYWVKASFAQMNGKPVKPLLAELIKRDFRTLTAGSERSSYPLNSFFAALENEPK